MRHQLKFIRVLCYNRTIATRLHEEIIMTNHPPCPIRALEGDEAVTALANVHKHYENEVRVLTETLQRCKEVGNFTAECYRQDADTRLLRTGWTTGCGPMTPERP